MPESAWTRPMYLSARDLLVILGLVAAGSIAWADLRHQNAEQSAAIKASIDNLERRMTRVERHLDIEER